MFLEQLFQREAEEELGEGEREKIMQHKKEWLQHWNVTGKIKFIGEKR